MRLKSQVISDCCYVPFCLAGFYTLVLFSSFTTQGSSVYVELPGELHRQCIYCLDGSLSTFLRDRTFQFP